jgi:hypothetical protein
MIVTSSRGETLQNLSLPEARTLEGMSKISHLLDQMKNGESSLEVNQEVRFGEIIARGLRMGDQLRRDQVAFYSHFIADIYRGGGDLSATDNPSTEHGGAEDRQPKSDAMLWNRIKEELSSTTYDLVSSSELSSRLGADERDIEKELTLHPDELRTSRLQLDVNQPLFALESKPMSLRERISALRQLWSRMGLG